ncbi:hypothetical protein FIBSPDRAFT_892620 [Athelia psychrophila]|uniref:Uncharacterized protein n=1 Tax=Athelia psychrophila TaxID=1759441 RepID=A0A166I100_9AGAM|nr:hypothetical protein FIBSPDRAFT_892620 [Fibularhizoctonia sp. CBS 109695]
MCRVSRLRVATLLGLVPCVELCLPGNGRRPSARRAPARPWGGASRTCPRGAATSRSGRWCRPGRGRGDGRGEARRVADARGRGAGARGEDTARRELAELARVVGAEQAEPLELDVLLARPGLPVLGRVHRLVLRVERVGRGRQARLQREAVVRVANPVAALASKRRNPLLLLQLKVARRTHPLLAPPHYSPHP